MTEKEYVAEYRAMKRIPAQLERARQRVEHLERMAVRYGLADAINSARAAA